MQFLPSQTSGWTDHESGRRLQWTKSQDVINSTLITIIEKNRSSIKGMKYIVYSGSYMSDHGSEMQI